MELLEAVTTVKALADGIDPVSKQPLPADAPYHNPVVVRALYTVLLNVRGAGQLVS